MQTYSALKDLSEGVLAFLIYGSGKVLKYTKYYSAINGLIIMCIIKKRGFFFKFRKIMNATPMVNPLQP